MANDAYERVCVIKVVHVQVSVDYRLLFKWIFRTTDASLQLKPLRIDVCNGLSCKRSWKVVDETEHAAVRERLKSRNGQRRRKLLSLKSAHQWHWGTFPVSSSRRTGCSPTAKPLCGIIKPENRRHYTALWPRKNARVVKTKMWKWKCQWKCHNDRHHGGGSLTTVKIHWVTVT